MMDEIKERYIELTSEEGGVYVFKGHGLDKQKIKEFLETQNIDEKIEIYETKETGGHWGFSADPCEADRYMYWDKKYIKVRGGFPITLVYLN